MAHQGIVKADKKAWLFTIHISSTQCSVDHLAILWCRQFVDDLARVLISISVACGGIEYDEAQYAALPPLKVCVSHRSSLCNTIPFHCISLQNVSSCTAIGRVKAIHAALTAPVDAVYDTDSEFNPEWYQHVLVAGKDVAVSACTRVHCELSCPAGSSVIFGLPYALSSVLSLVSLLVLAKSSVNQPLPCHSSGCLRSLLHSVAPWNHLPLLLAPVYTLKYPLQGALSWYASAVATAMPGRLLRDAYFQSG